MAGTLRRAASVDFRRAESVPLEGLDDPVVLTLAAEEGRVLVSHDVSTMERHFQDFIRDQKSPGIILIPQMGVSIRQAVDGLILLWEVLEATDLENRVCVFPSLVIY